MPPSATSQKFSDPQTDNRTANFEIADATIEDVHQAIITV